MYIDDKQIAVDDFGRPCRAYFLSHLHADHTAGLKKGWKRGPLFCSPLTAKLLEEKYGINGDVVRPIAPGETLPVDAGDPKASVSAIEANHCPGAVMFHFGFSDRRVLYTGDFRFDDAMRVAVLPLRGVDVAWIDGTYDDPAYTFPSQDESIERVLQLVAENMDKEVFLAVYTIGKTKLLRAVHDEFGLPIYVSDPVMRSYRTMGLEHLVTRDAAETNLRGYFRGYYYQYFRYKHRRYRKTHAVIIPTGWAVDTESCPHGYFYVPYSEHCDYNELQAFRALLAAKEENPI